jgi:hypothetical protein
LALIIRAFSIVINKGILLLRATIPFLIKAIFIIDLQVHNAPAILIGPLDQLIIAIQIESISVYDQVKL